MKRANLVQSIICVVCSAALLGGGSPAPGAEQDNTPSADQLSGLELRGIGPALMSGRIADIAKHPTDRSIWYVAVASGGVWKTVNAATTWTPIFDDQASYSIGTVTIDPRNPEVIWIGTGENNSQRSVGYGDGVYKSLDGGASWTNTGLETSEHIGKIVIDPRDSDVVWVASQGPLWAPGGERGLYKTTDGGSTWELSLEISDNTGVSDVVLDPRDPDVLYAASFQRRRHQWTVVAGGPESRIFKSTDGGTSWRQLAGGLPGGNVGRIGLALSPHDPDVLYATIAAEHEKSGFYRSTDRGESWEKRSDYVAIDPQYYQEIFPDPHRPGRLYVMDVWIQVSDDDGATWSSLNSRHKHVDNHAMVFEPGDPDYLMVGCDGGIYESWDLGETWRFIDNLPITQFYRVGVDNALPFYNLYGGTQDNDTEGGPSRTPTVHGIRNSDWFITVGGDGYQTRVDPDDPNILYSMWQYGGLVRYDRRSGERLDIQPQPEAGDAPLKWNWDSPLLISPHSGTRLYFAANRLFRSDDRGDSWRPVSPDLTRQLDRNELEVMGTVWSVDAVWKNVFTSFYGSIVALDESPLIEGLLYAGTDDGLVQVSEDGGESWRAVAEFPGIPERTYVSDVTASLHDADTVYATFNNHKMGDFEPYVLKSTDRGRSWSSVAGDLPDRHVAWSIVEDHERAGLLFVGTEFGLFVSLDDGGRWIQLTGGVPTVAFRDLEIQRRENDLVAATFGRGFYILDDYSPLREIADGALGSEGHLFGVKDAWMYLPSQPLGWGEKAVQGDGYFTAPNPPFGAVFTYWLADDLESLRDARRRREAELQEKGEPVGYPSWEELRAEDRAADPRLSIVIRDGDGRRVRVLGLPPESGLHRVAWDLRYPSTEPLGVEVEIDPWDETGDAGPPVAPGRFSAQLTLTVDGRTTPLGEAQEFDANPLGLATLAADDRGALVEFQRRAGRLQRAALGADRVVHDVGRQLAAARAALTAVADVEIAELDAEVERLRLRQLEFEQALHGDRSVSRRREPVLPGLLARIDRTVAAHWSSTSTATATHRRNYEIAAGAFAELHGEIAEVLAELEALQNELERVGAPWTPGRGLPRWRPE